MAGETYVVKAVSKIPYDLGNGNHIVQTYVTYWTSANAGIRPNLVYTRSEIERFRKQAYKTQNGAERGVAYIKKYYCCPLKDYLCDFQRYGKEEASKRLMEKARNYDSPEDSFSVITFSDMLSECEIVYRDEY